MNDMEDDNEEKFETCIKCGKLTTVEKTDNVVYRFGYIEGAGQLCLSCSQIKKERVNYGRK